MRVGLLGASRIAPKAIIAPIAKRDDMQIVALACRDVTRGEAYAREHNLGPIDVLDSYEALCARDDIDLIYNALPPSLHLETAKLAARTDRMQLIEKPLAMNTRQAAEIIALPSALTMEAFHYVFHPAFSAFEKAVRNLGPLRHITGRFHATIPNRPGQLRYIWELGGGALLDLGCYPLHMARWLSEREPRVVSASGIKDPGGVDVQMEAELDFGNHLTATISCDMREGIERLCYIDAVGERGTARLDNPVHPYSGFTLTTPDGIGTLDDHPDWADYTTYDAQLDEIWETLRQGAKPVTGGAKAVAQMAAIDAIYDAAGFPAR